jgi:hypothetical protein
VLKNRTLRRNLLVSVFVTLIMGPCYGIVAIIPQDKVMVEHEVSGLHPFSYFVSRHRDAVCIVNGTFFNPLDGTLAVPEKTTKLGPFIGISILEGGSITCTPALQGYTHVNSRATVWRTCLGVRADEYVIIVAKGSLKQMAKKLKAYGCMEAIALDGGSSSAIYHKGVIKKRSIRKISNVYIFRRIK